jgi:hypothetical protein
MSDPAPAAAPPPGSKPITVRDEWILILIFSAIVVILEVVGPLSSSESPDGGNPNPFEFMAAIAWWLGHGVWVSMDRRRRGLEVGYWRFLVLFFGFLATWTYMLLEYRLKGLLLILASIGIYSLIAVLILGILTVAGVPLGG